MFGFIKKNRKVIINNEEVKANKKIDDSVNMKKDYIENILRTKKLPIVLLDPLWHTAKEHIQSSQIDKDEKELQELLKEQARLNTDYKEYTAIKQNFLKQILAVSGKVQETGNQDAVDELNRLHQSTLGANNKLEEIEDRLGHMDEEIEEKNKQIISELVAIGYSYIESYKEEIITLDAEIEALREKMLRKTNEKKEDEAKLKDIYHYLHSIIGREHIEVMDRLIGGPVVLDKEVGEKS